VSIGCKNEVSGIFSRGTCLPFGKYQKNNNAKHLDTADCR